VDGLLLKKRWILRNCTKLVQNAKKGFKKKDLRKEFFVVSSASSASSAISYKLSKV